MKARKRPVVIECFDAAEMDSEAPQIFPQWLVKAVLTRKENVGAVWAEGNKIYAHTKEGVVSGNLFRTMIMRGVQGEIYLCDKEIFDQSYEVVNE